MEKISVSLVFPRRDKQELYVSLEAPANYDFSKFKNFNPRYLEFANKKVQIKYVGMGDIKGIIVVAVKLDDSKYADVEQIGELKGPDIFLEYEC